jgi:hypothetical protein
MSFSVAEERPVYVQFEFRAVEDREASIKEGHFVSRDVAFIKVTPPGGKLEFDAIASEWLERKRTDKFYDYYVKCFNNWQQGETEPEYGTSIKQWPAISPAQVATCIAANIKTVEDLATAPAPALQRMGMGAIALQKKAQAWLQTAQDTGKTAEEVNSLRRDNEVLTGQVSELTAKVEALLAASDAPRQTRPRAKPEQEISIP